MEKLILIELCDERGESEKYFYYFLFFIIIEERPLKKFPSLKENK
jgi:hypothetical protein